MTLRWMKDICLVFQGSVTLWFFHYFERFNGLCQLTRQPTLPGSAATGNISFDLCLLGPIEFKAIVLLKHSPVFLAQVSYTFPWLRFVGGILWAWQRPGTLLC